MSYFPSHLDASSGTRKNDSKYLDSAHVLPTPDDACGFIIHFGDGTNHRLSVASINAADMAVIRQVCLYLFRGIFQIKLYIQYVYILRNGLLQYRSTLLLVHTIFGVQLALVIQGSLMMILLIMMKDQRHSSLLDLWKMH